MSEAQRFAVTQRRKMEREQLGSACSAVHWNFYAQAAAIAYKSEEQISSWRANSDQQFKEFLSHVTAGPFKSKRFWCFKSFCGELL